MIAVHCGKCCRTVCLSQDTKKGIINLPGIWERNDCPVEGHCWVSKHESVSQVYGEESAEKTV